MKQIITQHGWCLNSNMWFNLKNKFKEENYYWQDNERGYFKGKFKDSKWKENNSEPNLKIILSHSLGTQLINRNVLKNASHAILINSFFNFLPKSNRRNLIKRTLQKMEKKIQTKEVKTLIREFITRAIYPHSLEKNFRELLRLNYEDINSNLLLDDLKKLYTETKNNNYFSRDCKILIIQSKNDLILEDDSIKELIKILNIKQNKNPKIIQLEDQGHIVVGNSIFNIIKNWLA